jgi:predicted MFS family arabinose efflux permease
MSNTDIQQKSATEGADGKIYINISMTLVMAITCGMAVANIYYNQPLLSIMQSAFPGQTTLTSFVATATQLGYAMGLILLVPLGDRIERRRLILMQTAGLAFALTGVALAPDAYTLLLASVFVGLMASVAQQILPFAAELAAPSRRGTTIGIVMSGLLCGILLSRVLAGAIGEYFGWRAMFWLGLGLALLMGLVLALTLPQSHPRTNVHYNVLLRSLLTLWHEEPKLRRATLIQANVFGSFSALWTILALHLDIDYQLSAEFAGMFGLVGATGVLFAPMAGKIADGRGPHFVIGMATLIILGSWMILGLWHTMAGMIVGVILLDFGAQSAQVSNQHVIHALRPDVRNRLNAVLMGGMFIGGALGSAGASLAWTYAGWPAVSVFAAVLAALAGLIHRNRLQSQ